MLPRAAIGAPSSRYINTLCFALMLAFALAGCSSPLLDSDDTNLRDKVIPELAKWEKSPSRAMPLRSFVTLSSYDHICLIAEYESLSDVMSLLPEANRPQAPKNLGYVPEGYGILIATRSGRLKHALFLSSTIPLRRFVKPCV